MKKTSQIKTLFITSLILVSGIFSSCNKKISSSSIFSSSINSTNSSFVETSSIPKEKINKLIDNIKNNFSFEFMDNTSYLKFYIQQNIIHFFTSLEDTNGSYIEIFTDKAYLYAYDQNTASWHKSNILALDYSYIIKDKLSRAKWTSYDEESDTFFGTYEEQEISAKIDSNSSLLVKGQNLKMEVFNIDSTFVSLPHFDVLIDETNIE